MAETESISEEVKKQREREQQIYEDNTTEEEREIWWKLLRIFEHFRDNIFPQKFDEIKMDLLYSKEYERDLKRAWVEHKSAKIYPLIQMVQDTFISSFYDTNLQPKVFPIDQVDPKVLDNATRFFQWWIQASEADDTMEEVRNEGTLIWASYWIPWYQTSSITDSEWNKKAVFVPMVYPVSFFEIFYTIWATDFYKAPEKFRRRFIPYDRLKYVYQPMWDWKRGMWKKLAEKMDAILNNGRPLSKADFTKIYDIEAYSNKYLSELWDWYATWSTYDNTFNVLDTSNYCEVVELYIKDKLMIFVNGYVVYDDVSPFYYWEDWFTWQDWPFLELTFEKKKWSQPNGIAHKIMGIQKQCNALYNSIWDAIYRELNPMYATVKWSIEDPSAWWTPTTITYQEGKVYQVSQSFAQMNPLNTMNFLNYNFLSLAMSHLESLKQDAFNIVWLNSYVLWGEWKVERSRYGAEQKVNSSKARLAGITKSIGRFYSKLFYHWLWLAKTAWVDVAYIQNDEWEFLIDLNQFDKKMWIVCSAENNIEEANASKLQWQLTIMQNVAPFMTNAIDGLPDMDMQSFLDSVSKNAWLEWIHKYTEDEKKAFIDEEYRIKDYIQQKELELQQKAQESQPQQAMPVDWQWMPMQQQWEAVDESQLDFIMPQ